MPLPNRPPLGTRATVRMQSAVDANTALPIKLVHPWVTQKTCCTLDWCSKAGWSCHTSAAALEPFWIFPANGRKAGMAIRHLTQLPPRKQSRTWAVSHKDHDTSSGAALARVGTPSGGSHQHRGPCPEVGVPPCKDTTVPATSPPATCPILAVGVPTPDIGPQRQTRGGRANSCSQRLCRWGWAIPAGPSAEAQQRSCTAGAAGACSRDGALCCQEGVLLARSAPPA